MIITRAAKQPDVLTGPCGTGGQAGVGGVLLDPVAGRVDPRPEVGERAGEARDLTVDAVDDQRGLHQQGAGQQPAPGAGGEAQGGSQSDEEREDRDLVGREPHPQRQSGQRRRGLAQDEGGVEAVVGAVGSLKQDAGLIDDRQLRLDLRPLLCGAAAEHRADGPHRAHRDLGPHQPHQGQVDRIGVPAEGSRRRGDPDQGFGGRRNVAGIDHQGPQRRRVGRTHVVHRRASAGDPLLGDPHRGGIHPPAPGPRRARLPAPGRRSRVTVGDRRPRAACPTSPTSAPDRTAGSSTSCPRQASATMRSASTIRVRPARPSARAVSWLAQSPSASTTTSATPSRASRCDITATASGSAGPGRTSALTPRARAVRAGR